MLSENCAPPTKMCRSKAQRWGHRLQDVHEVAGEVVHQRLQHIAGQKNTQPRGGKKYVAGGGSSPHVRTAVCLLEGVYQTSVWCLALVSPTGPLSVSLEVFQCCNVCGGGRCPPPPKRVLRLEPVLSWGHTGTTPALKKRKAKTAKKLREILNWENISSGRMWAVQFQLFFYPGQYGTTLAFVINVICYP